MIKEVFFFFFEDLVLCEEDDDEDDDDDGGDGGGGIPPFPLSSGGADRKGLSTPLSSLGVEVLSPQPFLNSRYISSTMARIVVKMSMN